MICYVWWVMKVLHHCRAVNPGFSLDLLQPRNIRATADRYHVPTAPSSSFSQWTFLACINLLLITGAQKIKSIPPSEMENSHHRWVLWGMCHFYSITLSSLVHQRSICLVSPSGDHRIWSGTAQSVFKMMMFPRYEKYLDITLQKIFNI